MAQPHFSRRYELLSFALNALVPVSLVVVIGLQQHKLYEQAKRLERLELEVATIKLNTLPSSNASFIVSPIPKSASNARP